MPDTSAETEGAAPRTLFDNIIKEAISFQNIGRLREAASRLQQSLAFRPNDPMPLLALGEVYLKLDEPSKAAQVFQQALVLSEKATKIVNQLTSTAQEQARLKTENKPRPAGAGGEQTSSKHVDSSNNPSPQLADVLKNAMPEQQQAYHSSRYLPSAALNLGRALVQVGRFDAAASVFRKGLHHTPHHVALWVALGDLFKDLFIISSALEFYQKALEISPNSPEALTSIGEIYSRIGKPSLAVQSFLGATKANPPYARAFISIGDFLRGTGNHRKAIQYFNRAIEIAPTNASAFLSRGAVYKNIQYFDKALRDFRACVDLEPTNHHAFYHIVHIEHILASWEQRQTHVQRLIEIVTKTLRVIDLSRHIRKGYPDSMQALSFLERETGTKEALSTCLQPLPQVPPVQPFTALMYPLSPDQNQAIARAYSESDEAAVKHIKAKIILQNARERARAHATPSDALDEGSDISSSDAEAAHVKRPSKIWLELSTMRFENSARFAVEQFCFDFSKFIDPGVFDLWEPEIGDIREQPCEPYTQTPFLKVPDSGLVHASLHNVFPLRKHPLPPFRCTRTPLRIGYVYADFLSNHIGRLIEGIFHFHDRRRVTVFCYALRAPDDSPSHMLIKQHADKFVDLSAKSTEEAATRIYSDGIQVLVNLNGHTRHSNNRIFALRPAPVQVSMLGFPGTMGAGFIDYLVTDEVAAPKSLAHLFSEQLVHMPLTSFVSNNLTRYKNIIVPEEELRWTAPHSIEAQHAEAQFAEFEERKELPFAVPITGTKTPLGRRQLRRFYGIPEDAFAFCCFNKFYKLDPSTMQVILQVLHSVPGSVLLFIRHTKWAERNIRGFATKHGFDETRIIFLKHLPREDHVRRCSVVDVFLDTPLWNGHTTVADVLFAGVPVVAFPGEKLCSRISTSLLHAAGCGELVADSFSRYGQIAVRLALDATYYAEIRARLIRARTEAPLFDTESWVRDFETAAHLMFRQWTLGGKPVTFSVAEAAQEIAGEAGVFTALSMSNIPEILQKRLLGLPLKREAPKAISSPRAKSPPRDAES